MVGVLLGSALHRAGWTIETSPGDPVYVVRGDARLEPTAIGNALEEGKLGDADWAAACGKHGIGDLLLAGPDLPMP